MDTTRPPLWQLLWSIQYESNSTAKSLRFSQSATWTLDDWMDYNHFTAHDEVHRILEFHVV